MAGISYKTLPQLQSPAANLCPDPSAGQGAVGLIATSQDIGVVSKSRSDCCLRGKPQLRPTQRQVLASRLLCIQNIEETHGRLGERQKGRPPRPVARPKQSSSNVWAAGPSRRPAANGV